MVEVAFVKNTCRSSLLTVQQESRGVANPNLVKAKQARREEAERKAAQAELSGGGSLKVRSVVLQEQSRATFDLVFLFFLQWTVS